jgi:hypothetical protein
MIIFNKDNFFVFETLKTWFEKYTQITQFSFLTYRHMARFFYYESFLGLVVK